MRQILTTLMAGAALCSLGLAASWSGNLMDATCYSTQKKADGCAATSKTTAFAIMDSSGKFYKLDAKGNTLAAEAVKNRADRAADPNNPHAASLQATVTGTEKDGMIEATAVDVR